MADIAVKTGKGRSTVARDITRAKKVAVLDDIAGLWLLVAKLANRSITTGRQDSNGFATISKFDPRSRCVFALAH